jgi:GntR family transcriptional regulator / MocR family aminotransferase
MLLNLNGTRGPLYRRIYQALKSGIHAGRLGAAARLPSTRSLAADLGVSRNTVMLAYEQLAAEGYVVSRHRSTTSVAGATPPRASTAPSGARAEPPPRISAYAERLTKDPAMPPSGSYVSRPGIRYDFRYGRPTVDEFPREIWRRLLALRARRSPRDAFGYASPAGYAPLREALAEYLARARGLACDAEQIVIVNGSQQGLDVCARLLLDHGDRVLMEDPGYVLARQIFLAGGAEVMPVAADREGMQTEGLPAARLAYTTPSHQFPLGGVLSAGRRRELLAWARHNGAYVIEDDYDSEYRYDIAPITPLQALDEAGRVIYLGTVSKTLSPTLRLGYLVVPPPLALAFARAKRLTDRHSPSLEQEALAELIESGAYERHVRRVRRRNGERRGALLAALSATTGDAVTVVGADAGLHIVAWLNGVMQADEAAFIDRAQAAGLGLYPLSPLYAADRAGTSPQQAGLVIGYASLDEPAIRRGVRLLASLLGRDAGG